MTRDFAPAFEAALRDLSPSLATLLAIETGDTGTPWIRLTSTDQDFTFNGDLYTSRPFEVGEFEVSAEGGPSLSIRLADVDEYFSTWLLTTDFRWKTLARMMIDREVPDEMQLDWFRISNHDRSDREFVFTVEPRLAILGRIMVPGQILTRDEFKGIPSEGVIG